MKRHERGGIVLWLLVILLLIIVLVPVYLLRSLWLTALAEWWIVDDPLEKSQVILVLGGDDYNADRIRHAVALQRAGWAPRLLLSGAPVRPYLHESELMARDAAELGVGPDQLILVKHNVSSTLEEALALRAVLAEHNFRKIIVVTSNFHTRRARSIYLAVYQKAGTQIIMSAAPDPVFKPDRWWQEREGRATVVFELIKSAYTWWELFWLPQPLPPPAPESGGRQAPALPRPG